MHQLSGSLVLAYHGCDADVAERILSGEPFTPSTNRYDWLGSGICFWESNPRRGLTYARQLQGRKLGKPVARPTVIGAVINPGLCLDLTTEAGIVQIEKAYQELRSAFQAAGEQLPANHPDLRRNLDCAVINFFHELRSDRGEAAVDTVRGVFVEGGPIYPDAGIYQKTHIQLAVRNAACIKGVFRVPASELD